MLRIPRRATPLIYFGRVLFAEHDWTLGLDRAGLRTCYGLWSQLEGSAELHRGNRRQVLRPGAVAVSDPGWSLVVRRGGRLAYICFDLFARDDSVLLDRREVPEGPPQPSFTELIGSESDPVLSPELWPGGAVLADVLISTYWADDLGNWDATARLFQWMVDLLRQWRLSGASDAVRDAAGIVQRAEAFIRSRLPHGVTVAQVASAVGLSRNRFADLFDRHHGIGPGRYIDALQIDRACQLLRETDQSIAEIAAGCGFRSVSTLFRRFRTIHGLSPQRWRRWQQRLGR